MSIFTFAVNQQCPALGLLPGDILILAPETEDPIVLQRPLSLTRSVITTALSEGVLQPLNGEGWPLAEARELREFLAPKGPTLQLVP